MFGDLEVVKEINCHIQPQEGVWVFGGGGAGRITCLGGVDVLETMTSGEIIVDGDHLSDPKIDINDVRTEIGMVFQQFNLFPHKSVIENVMLAPQKVRRLSNDEARKRALALLEKVGIGDKADNY